MSLFKNADGIYEADVRVVGAGRWHGSMRTRKRSEAEPRYDAVRRLFREAKGAGGAERQALIAQLRDGSLTIERLTAMVAGGEALVPFAAAAAAADRPTVDAMIERYIIWLRGNPKKAKATWEHAAAALRRFANFTSPEIAGGRMGDLPFDGVTAAQVEAYQRTMLAEKAAPSTVSAYTMRVGALWKWAARRETRRAIEERRSPVIVHSPVDSDSMIREHARRDRWLTRDEAEQLLAATPDRLMVAVAMGLFNGLRIIEILTLRRQDIDLELGTITIAAKQVGVDDRGHSVMWRPKTRRSRRVVPIASDLRPVLERHLERYAADVWLLPSLDDPARPFVYETFNTHFNQIVGDAELIVGRKDPRGVVFHTLRHTFASWLVMSGQVDLYTVAQLLGDSLQVVEDTYAHLAPDFKRKAIDAIKGAVVVPVFEVEATVEASDFASVTNVSQKQADAFAGYLGTTLEVPR